MNIKEKKVPYNKKPEGLSIDKWQVLLRKQFGIKQDFEVSNDGAHPVFSDYTVYNPATESTYKVAVRNIDSGDGNFCSCPDFMINQLGTCKHLEYVLYNLKIDEAKEGYFNDVVQSAYSSLSIRYEKERRIFFKIAAGKEKEFGAIVKKYFNAEGYLLPDKLCDVDDFIKNAQRIDSDLRVYPDVIDFISSYKSKQNRMRKLKLLFPKKGRSPYFKSLIKANLYPYQKEGVLFCVRAGRVLLADDMGLGKTVQTLAAVELFIKEFSVKKVLIVCPTSLKHQWFAEIEKFTDRQAHIVEGAIHKRKKQYMTESVYTIISYGVVGNDLDIINNSHFDLVIVDEAQRIKNWNTRTAKSVKKIATEYALVLTGTPLENRIEELHSIVEFVDRYKLGALFRFLYKHQIYDDSYKVIGYTKLHEINSLLSDILLRRTKKEIINQLPGRVDKTYFVGMTREQQKYHNSYYDIVARIVTLWKRKGFLTKEERESLLINLSCMRMSCDSTYILDQTSRHDTKIDELMKILDDIFTDEGNKVVIFSQWERMTRLVAEQLGNINIGYQYLHGGVPANKRKNLISNFHENSDSRVFLSTDAGGVGLNLQCASIIINLDIPWNPAVLEQRIGRVYRLGQKNKVRVINMVAHATIEHRILYLLDYKRAVFSGILEKGDDTVLMNNDGMKSFMKSIEELTDASVSNGIYITPHAESGEENNDYEYKESGSNKVKMMKVGNEISGNLLTKAGNTLRSILQGLKGLFK